MATTRRSNLTSNFNRSPFISERRRKLFPTEDLDLDSELGHISPLRSETASDSETELENTISDYDIVRIVQNKNIEGSETPTSFKACSETMSPLCLSPFKGSSYLSSTPKKFSPSQSLKTPHDTSVKPNNVLQKEQKMLLEESKTLKRKISPLNSPEQVKDSKTDLKSSKVRTALFPPEGEQDISLSVKSFYSRSQENVMEKLSAKRDKYISKPVNFSTAKHSHRNRKNFGQINNGVRHKIRKPKQKKMSKTLIAKAAKKLMETSSVLTEYIQDLSELQKTQTSEKKLIKTPVKGNINESLKNGALDDYVQNMLELNTLKTLGVKLISSPVKVPAREENKENVPCGTRKRPLSPFGSSSLEEPKNRKFFKSSRVTVTKRTELRTVDTQTNAKTSILANKAVENGTCDVEFDTSDLDDDDIVPKANIDSLLSTLSESTPEKKESTQSHYSILTEDESLYWKDTQEGGASSVSNFEVISTIQNIDSQFLKMNNYTDNNTNQCQDVLVSNVTQQNQGTNYMNQISCFDNGLMDQSSLANFVDFDSLLTDSQSQVVFNRNMIENTAFLTPDTSTDIVDNYSPSTNTSQGLNTVILEAHNSITASENSIQLHTKNIANMILSPISQMCDVTSGLALDSPKKCRNLMSVLNSLPRTGTSEVRTNGFGSVDMEGQKLFPVFCTGAKSGVERGEKRDRSEVKRGVKKFRALSEDQMLLDAGQKKFGHKLCHECNLVYHMGDPGDEIAHMNYHNSSHVLRFVGWKNEHVVADFHKDGRIIRILPTDSKIWLKKVKDLMEVVKRDLGCYEMEYDIRESQVYFYIKNRTIAGCAVATVPKQGGHRMLSTTNNVAMCSEASYPIKCGISHLWVAANFRKQGIATALMTAVKNSFVYGYILSNNEIALTSPTEDGAAFAEKYFKSTNYLVYFT